MTRCLLVLTGLLMAAGPLATADTLLVPSDYATIQAALDAAVAGDVVELADGTYAGVGNRDLDFNGKAITLRSASGDATACIIDCESAGRGINFRDGEGPDTIVRDITITNGSATKGGAIHCDIASSPTLIGCRIIGNTATRGGGVYCEDDSDATLIKCLIADNAATGGANARGGGVCAYRCSPTLINCRIVGNTCEYDGGGAYCDDNSGLALINCELTGNAADGEGGGVSCVFMSDALISGCTIADNTAQVSGGGVYTTFSSPTIVNSIIWGNSPQQIGLSSGGPSVSYSCVEDSWPGTGNLSGDPLLADPDGPDDDAGTWVDNDYRLAPGSPCIDHGNNTSVPNDAADIDGDNDFGEALPLDLAGAPRFADDPNTPDLGNGAAPLVDMGAYEFVPGGVPSCPGDMDGSGGIDDADLAPWFSCLAGPITPAAAPCDVADMDGDADVDIRDLAAWQLRFGATCGG